LGQRELDLESGSGHPFRFLMGLENTGTSLNMAGKNSVEALALRQEFM
jgi:hypothetical protein